jgi:outer membrane protein, multidrug efflux system
VARAAFFRLTDNYGTAGTQLSGLFDHGSTAWTFSPQISLPIFAAGAHVAAIDLAKVEKNIYIVQYGRRSSPRFAKSEPPLPQRTVPHSAR